jgi:TolA-binding protein
LLALVQGKDGMGAAEALLAENKRLKQQLDEANAKVATLSTDNEAAVKEATALREQIAAVRDELERTKKENEDYRQQIAGLRTKLEAATEQLVDATPLAKDDTELASENRMLRKMIVDQLKHQSFREEKKRLALEQLAKLQINNEDLLNTLDQLAAPPPTLSAEETQRIQDPVITQFVEQQGLSGTLIARAEDGAAAAGTAPDGLAVDEGADRPGRAVRRRQDLTGDLQTVAEAGLGSLSRGRLSEARRAFQTILREDPTNLFGLSNLAVAQVKQQDYTGAEKTLKKALAYDEQDAFCHYLLGVVGYRQGQLEESERSLINSLQFDPKNARAFFTLGCVQNRRGRHRPGLRRRPLQSRRHLRQRAGPRTGRPALPVGRGEGRRSRLGARTKDRRSGRQHPHHRARRRRPGNRPELTLRSASFFDRSIAPPPPCKKSRSTAPCFSYSSWADGSSTVGSAAAVTCG